MKFYQPQNSPIRFNLVSRENNVDNTREHWIYEIAYGSIPKIGMFSFMADTNQSSSSVIISWTLMLNYDQNGAILIDPHRKYDTCRIINNEDGLQYLLDDIAQHIADYYKQRQQDEETPVDIKDNATKSEEPIKVADTIRQHIKISNIIYNLDGVPNQSPTPIYEIEVKLTNTDVYSHIKSSLLNVHVCYDDTSQKFHAKIETVRINDVPIADLHLDNNEFLELTSVYMRDALKRIDFVSAIENHLMMLDRRLDMCHKVLNSNLES